MTSKVSSVYFNTMWSRLHNSSAYNMVAKRFVNPATGRFITNASGYRNYLLGPVTGITYNIGSNIYSSKKN